MPRLTVVLTGGGDDAALQRSLASLVGQGVDLEVRRADATDVEAAVEQAGGEYLTFLAIGDEVAAGGHAALVGALDESGSDVAVGRPAAAPPEVAEAFARRRTGTTVERVPALLTDDAAGNKVWRRAFWEARPLGWPGMPPTAVRAVVLCGLAVASTIDVLPDLALARRDTGPPARAHRPRTGDMVALADHLDTLLAVSAALERDQRPRAKKAFDGATIAGVLRFTLSQLTEADDATQRRLVETTGAFLVGAGPVAERSERAIHRLKFHLARRRLLPQLIEVVKAQRTGELVHAKVVRRGISYYGDYPFRTDRALRVPREVYRLRQELNLRTRIDDVRWEGDALVVDGVAHIGLLDVATPRAGRVWLSLLPSDGGRSVRLPVERRHRPDVTAESKDSPYTYDWSGFRTSIPLSALAGRGPGTRWQLRAAVVRGGVARRRFVTATSPGRARRPPLRELADGSRIVAVTEAGTFEIEVDPVPAVAEHLTVDGAELLLAGRVRVAAGEGATLRLDTPLGDGPVVPVTLREEHGAGRFEARLPLDAITRECHTATLVLPGGTSHVLRAALSLSPMLVARPDGSEVRASTSRTGRLLLTSAPARPELVAATWPDGGELCLRLRDVGDDTEVVLHAAKAQREVVVATRATDTGRVALLDPARVSSLAGALPLTEGTWRMGVRRRGHSAQEPLTADATVVGSLPLRRQVGAKTFTVQEVDGGVELVAGPDLLDDERGAVNQRRLQRVEFPAFRARGLRDEVLFESYESRAYADNARAVFEELARRDTGLTCRWVVLDGQTELPDGLEPVRRHSREHYEALACSRYVVVPNYRPLRDWLTTPQDQVVVQTWHGAPFKKIGFDNERGERTSSRDYHDRLLRESARWDYLLSPNPPSTPILRGAFGFDGKMLETGYPRTDIFFRPDRDEIAERVRSRLGLPPGKKVALYAPTMRDDLRYGGNRFSLDLRLDLEKARIALGDDHVLLVRRHAKVVDTITTADGEFARDVSLWPDVNELLLATDVLITDYSSLMFDFADTGRPMLFFTYDLEDYRDRLRGFYFDVHRVPGPLLMTSDEVIAGIREAEQLRAEHDPAYRAFVRDFCAWDDGGAAARFVDEVFTRH
jgi:CDP-glycerol glycerophosphotransferase